MPGIIIDMGVIAWSLRVLSSCVRWVAAWWVS